MISQKQRISIQQKLSPQQIMLMKLLHVPTVSLEQTIKEEIEKNPLLEEDENVNIDSGSVESFKEEQEKGFDLRDYSGEDNTPNYRFKSNNYDNDEPKEIGAPLGKTLQEFLHEQLDLQDLSEKQKTIGEELIGNIDDAGYLDRDLNAMTNDFLFRYNIQTNLAEINQILEIIQTFDPSGVAARNLQECLLIQLKRLEPQTDKTKNAINILEQCYDSFTKKHYDKITKILGLSESELKIALDKIVKLNPKPGSSIFDSGKIGHYIIPDFIVYLSGNRVEFTLNNKYIPKLRVSKYYSDMLQQMGKSKKKTDEDKKAILFIKDKMSSAQWFIEILKQRQETLKLTMKSIINYQKDFFINGDISKLKPMLLKDISTITNLDISTISRVVNQKYAQTHFGTFLLKDFFSKSYTNTEGKNVAVESIKSVLIECIENEDKQKALTDEELTEILNAKGFPLARRTVTKYRESLNFPVGRLRKEVKNTSSKKI